MSDGWWESWRAVLDGFAHATGVAVSARDMDGELKIGPFCGSRLPAFLAEHGFFQGAGEDVERELTRRCLATGAEVRDKFEGKLHLRASPVRLMGEPRGVVICGWVLSDFASSLVCERIAGRGGAPLRKLWSVARLETPVSERRMDVFGSLLGTLLASRSELKDAIDKLEELRVARELFLSHVSHELRTPLAAITTRLELLLMSSLDDPARIRSELEKLRLRAKEEAKLVEDLLEAAVTKTGRFSVALSDSDLVPIVEAACDAVSPTAEARGVSLQASVGTRPIRVRCDASRMQQAVWNIVANAVKFTPPGRAVRVSVDDSYGVRASDENGAVITVADEGPGIPPEDVAGLFEPFTRRVAGNAKGLGLGLSIAKQIVELHGGEIDVSAGAGGRGAVFRIRLPQLPRG